MTKYDDDSSDKVPNHKNSMEISAHQLSETIMFGSLVTTNKKQEFEINKRKFEPF
jgi:hypothetical protein